jgi:hypothetical protein
MVSSGAATPEDYLRELAAERAVVVSAVCDMVNAFVPRGYVEGMAHGMIGWSVPLEVYPDTYNGKALSYAALAAQRSCSSLSLMEIYRGGPIGAAEPRERWSAKRRLDLGRSCVRLRTLDDLDLPLLAEVVASVPMERFVQRARDVARRR